MLRYNVRFCHTCMLRDFNFYNMPIFLFWILIVIWNLQLRFQNLFVQRFKFIQFENSKFNFWNLVFFKHIFIPFWKFPSIICIKFYYLNVHYSVLCGANYFQTWWWMCLFSVLAFGTMWFSKQALKRMVLRLSIIFYYTV